MYCVAVRLTRRARPAVWCERKSESTVTDSCSGRQREAEITAAAVVRPTRTYSDIR